MGTDKTQDPPTAEIESKAELGHDYGDLSGLPRPLFSFSPNEIEGWDDSDVATTVTDEPPRIALHWDQSCESSPSKPVETVYIQPVCIDTGPLGLLRERIRGGKLDPLRTGAKELLPTVEAGWERGNGSRWMDDMESASILLAHRRKMRAVDDSGMTSIDQLDDDILPYLRLAARCSDRQDRTSQESGAGREGSRTKHDAIHEALQRRWRQKSQQAAGVSRRSLRDQLQQARSTGDIDRQNALEHVLHRKNRELLESCIDDEVRHWKEQIQEQTAGAVEEIKNLYCLRQAMELEMFAAQITVNELIEALEVERDRVRRLVSRDDAFVDAQLEALSSLTLFGLHTTAALETRLNRLDAKDVEDGDERARVRDRRLSQPEALVYLSKARDDLQFIRDLGRTVLAGFDHVDGELQAMALSTMDLHCIASKASYLLAANAGLKDSGEAAAVVDETNRTTLGPAASESSSDVTESPPGALIASP